MLGSDYTTKNIFIVLYSSLYPKYYPVHFCTLHFCSGNNITFQTCYDGLV
uniref:Uncharacterized protein n=1 Tax=Anguilla anguilla TaxID=7936 RepID=A0A0E9VRD8_ANGAN